MVIIGTVLGAILFFASAMFIHKRTPRIIAATITGIIFIGSTALMTVNYSHHFGMHKVTTTTTRRIYSASDKLPVALYRPVGSTGEDDVYIYKTDQDQKKPSHTQVSEYTHSKMKRADRSTPRLVTKETRWEYKNHFYQTLFAWSGMDGTLVKRTNTLEYPRTYVKLTVNQAKQLAKLQKSPQAKQTQAAAQQKGQEYVRGQVTKAMAKNPNITSQQIQEISQKAQEQFEAKMVKQLLKTN